MRVAAAALTDNAAVVVTRQGEAGRVRAYARTDGKVLWETQLPGSPLYDGLAIAPNGTVLVALRDGQLLKIGE